MLSHITEITLTWETLSILLHRWVAYHSSIVCVVPEAPVQDLVQSFVIAAVVVKDHGGQAIAEEWKKSLANVGITKPDQLPAV